MVAVEVAERIRKEAEETSRLVETNEGFRASAIDQGFGCFFGRDALICSTYRLHSFLLHPESPELLAPVRKSLMTIALHLGRKPNPLSEEEEGRPPHELRYPDSPENIKRLDELERNKWPAGKDGMEYYGTIDAPALFVDVACKYIEATGDTEFFKVLDPYMRKTLTWMQERGDMLGDSFIRYSAQNRNALLNHGWKDSNDSIEIEPGVRPREPIALVEVQGYAYSAYVGAARLYSKVGDLQDLEYARDLGHKAGIIKGRFNRDFWMEEEGFFAFALDGDNKHVRHITSNVGHLLMTDIIDEDKRDRVVERLMKSDMFTPYGIRPLSSDSWLFSDKELAAYHRGGGIWPHDNALIYLGLKKHGYYKEAGEVRDAVLTAQYILSEQYGLVNPELYMVTKDLVLRPYLTAQNPQSWVGEADRVWTDPLEIESLLVA